jgi:hypothetical protein
MQKIFREKLLTFNWCEFCHFFLETASIFSQLCNCKNDIFPERIRQTSDLASLNQDKGKREAKFGDTKYQPAFTFLLQKFRVHA